MQKSILCIFCIYMHSPLADGWHEAPAGEIMISDPSPATAARATATGSLSARARFKLVACQCLRLGLGVLPAASEPQVASLSGQHPKARPPRS